MACHARASSRGVPSTSVVQQLELTFDTRACSVEQLIARLPREFDQWKQQAGLRL